MDQSSGGDDDDYLDKPLPSTLGGANQMNSHF